MTINSALGTSIIVPVPDNDDEDGPIVKIPQSNGTEISVRIVDVAGDHTLHISLDGTSWNAAKTDGTELLQSSNRWIDNIGFALLKNVDLEIGGQKIDTHT